MHRLDDVREWWRLVIDLVAPHRRLRLGVRGERVQDRARCRQPRPSPSGTTAAKKHSKRRAHCVRLLAFHGTPSWLRQTTPIMSVSACLLTVSASAGIAMLFTGLAGLLIVFELVLAARARVTAVPAQKPAVPEKHGTCRNRR